MNFENLGKKERFFDIWKNRKNTEILEPREAWIARAQEELVSYHKLWESGDVYQALNFKEGQNPFFHVTIRSIILEQIETGVPPETGKALEFMKKNGVEREVALDSIGIILADEMGQMIKNKKPLDRERYRSRIAKYLKNEDLR